jgi:hypothetical protein
MPGRAIVSKYSLIFVFTFSWQDAYNEGIKALPEGQTWYGGLYAAEKLFVRIGDGCHHRFSGSCPEQDL